MMSAGSAMAMVVRKFSPGAAAYMSAYLLTTTLRAHPAEKDDVRRHRSYDTSEFPRESEPHSHTATHSRQARESSRGEQAPYTGRLRDATQLTPPTPKVRNHHIDSPVV